MASAKQMQPRSSHEGKFSGETKKPMIKVGTMKIVEKTVTPVDLQPSTAAGWLRARRVGPKILTKEQKRELAKRKATEHGKIADLWD